MLDLYWRMVKRHGPFTKRFYRKLCNICATQAECTNYVFWEPPFSKDELFFNLIAATEMLASNLMFISFPLSDHSAWGSWNGANSNIFIVHRTVASEEDTVKCTLVQALRLCTDRTAHRGSRSIALLFHDRGTRRGWGVSITPWSLFTPGKDPIPTVQEAGWAPGPVWTGAENLAPHRDSIPGPSSP